MSYQVLARKWRPKSFETLVGQEHVVRALTHALDQQRLHHAWLFTGTRGVGKTTLARIMAKALNCVGPDGNGGVTSRPCGVCSACTEIDAGRFVDYIEMDAASNRGVDEMAQLLEQAIYAPSSARYKVYMIDEVHMLTSHAFNAMLKTLEEPPEHVKFILATTDPQKIPVTVLSRCLQFNLKQMPPERIVEHLGRILGEESVPFEPQALRLLAHAAQGSMRDALSLTDQAIAYSAGNVTAETVRGMLGALDQTWLVRILDALAARDGPALMTVADEIAARSLSFGAALQDLGVLLYRIALAQSVPEAIADDWPDAADVRRLAALFTPEEVQLYYQIAAHGRSDLGLAPDEYAGFAMTLLRMLAFRPVESDENARGNDRASPAETRTRHGSGGAAAGPADKPYPPAGPAKGAPVFREPPAATRPAALQARSPAPSRVQSAAVQSEMQPAVQPAAVPPDVQSSVRTAASHAKAVDFDGDWVDLAQRLRVTGLTRQLVQQAELISFENDTFKLRVPIQTLLNGGTLEKLKAALAEHFHRPMRVATEVGAVQGQTAAAVEQGERAVRQAEAEAVIEADPFVQALVKDFGATVIPGSVKPIQ